jgi:hypothetical protein
MSQIRVLTVAAGAAIALSFAPAQAAPFVGTVGQATGPVSIKGSDGKVYGFTFDLQEISPAGGHSAYSLTADIKRCDATGCRPFKKYSVPVQPSQVSASANFSAISVKTSLFGKPLVLQWSGDASPTPGIRATGTPVDVSVNGEQDANFFANIVGLKCRGTGSAGTSYLVSPTGYSASTGLRPTGAPAQFSRHRGKSPSCFSPLGY